MQRNKTQIYIVRVWKEHPKDEVWRGNIQNVRTGQRASASNMNELAEFIRRFFEQPAKTQPKQERGLR
jgi:hypothetical protein